ncbi:hypothetical protein COW36_24515 [bacterium (Candidatus Blackallbacteria) CG17_big_fil_post_rev_8_21_14_2_50_48_46]|uniref:Lipoprotein n=1 Tax=bacterium (Candidatus Blackallbacteria) CG17_big_fil_post_rev_8_21_14_2_50_48_46 TaxID=2014261 RepID=A0A2M7FXW0_9BACT|nr:MAG: hypothetical protein COW64_19455 [bacterium (Candidatus Blackallbacteria) CG18_big_fil_WC_8_21_14_2_50_49_26]PIW13833.1 MAG: hypothetical protein COW36_24515 [bacterium (Candidatus Blackallbacteria) CG17_big_fil_post_rev_8_21_14_2_50_48_46]PIW45059.1 MAG: hypothetical protein COW20_22145 [bacterium (Candidatus Blackallbacteria) CG13_big_fil_rev_8_21_14_2_50_49_14]
MYKTFLAASLFFLAACSPAANQTGNPITDAAIDAIVVEANKSCVEETTKTSGAEMATKICGCVSTEVGKELKKDPSAATDKTKLNNLMPGVTATCIKQIQGSNS